MKSNANDVSISSRTLGLTFFISLIAVSSGLVSHTTEHGTCGVDSQQPECMAANVAIIGASLGGLAAANALTRVGFNVHVYERSRTSFENKGHGLGYVDVALWESLCQRQMLRGGVQACRAQGAFYYGDLWKYLHDTLPQDSVRFGHSVIDLGDDPLHPILTIEKSASDTTSTSKTIIVPSHEYSLVVIADGGWSALRHHVTGSGVSAEPVYAGYVVWRGSVDAQHAPGFNSYGVFKNGIYDSIVLPLDTDKGHRSIMCGTFIATPEDQIDKPEAGAGRHTGSVRDGAGDGANAATTATSQPEAKADLPPWFVTLYKTLFRDTEHGELARLIDIIASKGKLQPHPQFEFGAKTITRGRLVVVGDAAHMASPRTAVGAHTAVMDAVGLLEAFARYVRQDGTWYDPQTDAVIDTDTAIDRALAVYKLGGVERAQGLLQRSHEVSTQFVPPGGPHAIVSPATLV